MTTAQAIHELSDTIEILGFFFLLIFLGKRFHK